MFIATLIAAGRLDDSRLERALARVPGARFAGWVDEGDAADLEVPDPAAARRALEGWDDCDVIVQRSAHRYRKLLVADMDSTMIGQECIDELADYAGVKDKVAGVTERAMRGELDFVSALRERVALLEGLATSDIATCLAERIRPNAGAETLVRTMGAHGATTLLVSGGFTDFVVPIAERLGFDQFRANRLARSGELLTGRVEGEIVDGDAKRASLVEWRGSLGLDRNSTMAIGDGANDLAMIEEAGLGIAYRAKPVLAEVADARLDHHGLDALLWAQGIAKKDWIEAR